MTKALQNKLEQLTALLSSEKDRKQLAKKLQQDINRMIARQPDLPHKGDDAWLWYDNPCYYGQQLYTGKIESVVWRPNLNCFKAGVRLERGSLVWRTLDRIWPTQQEAERWDIMRQIKVAQRNLEAAQKKLDDLNKQLEAT